MNFTWWVNRKDSGGNNVFEGGFLGLDNVGPFDRVGGAAGRRRAGAERRHRAGWRCTRSTCWRWRCVLADARPRPTWTSRRSSSSTSPTSPPPPTSRGCGTRRTRFFYDVLRLADGAQGAAEGALGRRPAAAGRDHRSSRSVTLHRLPEVAARLRWFLTNKPEYAEVVGARRIRDGQQQRLLSDGRPGPADAHPGRGCSTRRSSCPPYGLRTLSRAHLEQAVHGRRWAATTSPSATSRPSRPAACSAATPTGAGRSGCRSTTSHRGRCALRRRSSATTCWSSTRPAPGEKRTAGRDRRRPVRPAGLAVPARRRRPPADLRRRTELFQTRPGLAGPDRRSPSTSTATTGPAWAPAHQTGWTALVVDLILTLRRDNPDVPGGAGH